MEFLFALCGKTPKLEKNIMAVICFDLWNTLIRSLDGNGASYEEVLMRHGIERQLIYPIVRDELMRGEYTYKEMVRALFVRFSLPNNPEEEELAAQAWEQDNIESDWFHGATELLKELRAQGHQLVLMTNITAPAWKTVNTALGIGKYFNRLFLSWAEGASKPDLAVWERVESWFPGQRNFHMVGDSPADDLTIPKILGWKIHLAKKGDFQCI